MSGLNAIHNGAIRTGAANAIVEMTMGRPPRPARSQIAHDTASSIGITAHDAM